MAILQKPHNKILKIGLIWYAVTLILYGVVLYMYRQYDFLSTLYHLALLFPLLLVILKQETLANLGFRKGVIDYSVIMVVCFPVIIIIATIIFNPINIILSYGVFLSIIIAPITEEIFFRGFLQEKIYIDLMDFRWYWTIPQKYRKYLPIVITAVLFGLIHLARFSIGTYTVAGLLFAILFGGLAGWAYSEGKSIAYPILFHALWNLSVLFRGG